MHDQGVVHGDLKGVCFEPHSRHPGHRSFCSQSNILINHSGHACIHDFSLVTMVSDQQTSISLPAEGGTIRWMSPELIDPKRFSLNGSYPTKESDCYALGMVVYEVLSGQAPFAQLGEPIVIQKVMEGERPGRPQGDEGKLFTDAMWEVVELCWEAQPGDRTSAKAVLLSLEGSPPLLRPASNVDGDVGKDSNDQSDATAGGSSTFSLFHLWLSPNHPCGT